MLSLVGSAAYKRVFASLQQSSPLVAAKLANASCSWGDVDKLIVGFPPDMVDGYPRAVADAHRATINNDLPPARRGQTLPELEGELPTTLVVVRGDQHTKLGAEIIRRAV